MLEIVLNLAHLLSASGFLAILSCDSSYQNDLLMLHSLSPLHSLVADQSLEQELDARSCNEKGLVKTVLTFSTAAWQQHATNFNIAQPPETLIVTCLRPEDLCRSWRSQKKEDQLLHAIVIMILPARDLTTPANTLFRQPWMCETLEEDKWKRRSITNGHTVQQCSVQQIKTAGPKPICNLDRFQVLEDTPKKIKKPVGKQLRATLSFRLLSLLHYSVTIDPSHIWSPRHNYITCRGLKTPTKQADCKEIWTARNSSHLFICFSLSSMFCSTSEPSRTSMWPSASS